MKVLNEVKIQLESRSVNEGYARAAVSAFVCQLDPTLEELNDIKTAVSEAVTNCIVHAYKNQVGIVYISIKLFENSTVQISVRDRGCGIEDVKKAMEPLYTSAGEDRAGLGFSVMESFCDGVKVRSKKGAGTTVTLTKKIRGRSAY